MKRSDALLRAIRAHADTLESDPVGWCETATLLADDYRAAIAAETQTGDLIPPETPDLPEAPETPEPPEEKEAGHGGLDL